MALLSSILVPSSTETAVANGDTRTLNLYHSHTGESIQATFRVNGAYDPAVLERLNYFLRDWRNNDVTRMDPRLFDVIWEAYRTAGATQPIVIVSAYRSPATNAMLRARSHAVAEHSQHILGKAMDTTMPGMPMERIREIGMRLQRGGVGWYPSSNFVHLDVGSVRAWPRMTYDQLVRLFPDGKTVHLAADGRTLPRYEEARAEIASRGGIMSDVPQTVASAGGLFGWLFGNHEEERGEEKEAEAARSQPARPDHGRHGGPEVASLRTSADSSADAAPASPGKSVVADLGAAGNSPGTTTSRAVEQTSRAVEQDQSAAPAGSTNSGRRWTLSTPVPVPPQRPALASDVKLAFANVPAPPARPASLTRVAVLTPDKMQGGSQASKTDSKSESASDAVATTTPLTRATNLPVVITQGPKDHPGVPHHVLAFASDTPVQETDALASKTPGQTESSSTTQQAAATARLEQQRTHGLAGVLTASFPVPSILGPSFTGLRKAARIIPDALSNVPSAAYLSAFHANPGSDLDASHFTGTATKPLALAEGLVRVGDSSHTLAGE